MPQLPQCLSLDLPDAFAGYCERLAHFFQRVFAAILKTEAIAIASKSFFQ